MEWKLLVVIANPLKDIKETPLEVTKMFYFYITNKVTDFTLKDLELRNFKSSWMCRKLEIPTLKVLLKHCVQSPIASWGINSYQTQLWTDWARIKL